MKNKEAIEELKGLQEFINGTRLKGEIRAEAFDLAIKALETVDKIKAYIKKHNALDSLELMCIKDIINGENEE